MDCPICKKEMKVDSSYMDNTLVEDSASCKDDFHHYSYQYSYGNTEIYIDGAGISFHYTAPTEKRLYILKQTKALEGLATERYHMLHAEGKLCDEETEK